MAWLQPWYKVMLSLMIKPHSFVGNEAQVRRGKNNLARLACLDKPHTDTKLFITDEDASVAYLLPALSGIVKHKLGNILDFLLSQAISPGGHCPLAILNLMEKKSLQNIYSFVVES